MANADKVWLAPPWGRGEPQEVEAVPDVIVPRMVAGWSQCTPPEAKKEEVTNDVR